MSADNYMAVKKIGDIWHVWMVLGGYESEDWTTPGGSYHKEFEDELKAFHYAHKICNDEVVEYGVVSVPETREQKNDSKYLLGALKGFCKVSGPVLSLAIKNLPYIDKDILTHIRRLKSAISSGEAYLKRRAG